MYVCVYVCMHAFIYPPISSSSPLSSLFRLPHESIMAPPASINHHMTCSIAGKSHSSGTSQPLLVRAAQQYCGREGSGWQSASSHSKALGRQNCLPHAHPGATHSRSRVRSLGGRSWRHAISSSSSQEVRPTPVCSLFRNCRFPKNKFSLVPPTNPTPRSQTISTYLVVELATGTRLPPRNLVLLS
jgi:hypothetical protein